MRALVAPTNNGPLPGSVDLEDAYAGPTPWLRANFVTGLDGTVEVGGSSGALGGPADRKVFNVLRALTDAVLVGAGTARAERYGPVWLSEDVGRRRLERAQTEMPVVAVVTSSGRLDPASRLFFERRENRPEPPAPLVITCAAAPASGIEPLRAVATVLVCGQETVDLPVAIERLRSLGHARILCEGGPFLLGQLVAEDLLDELCLTHAPVLGGPGRRTLSPSHDGPTGSSKAKAAAAAGPGPPAHFELTQLLEEDGLLFARYLAGERR